MKSTIFTDAELKALERRRKGDKKDPTGIFHARVKPKLGELLEWFKIRREISSILKTKKKTEVRHSSQD